jgi:hypothetical protein
MSRFAVIEAGVVVNLAIAEPELAAALGWKSAPDDVQLGWLHDGGQFAPPEPQMPVPEVVKPRQARLALLNAGLLAGAEAALDALPSPQREAALIEWEYATEIRRDHALIAAIAAALSLTELQVDDLFRSAASL